MNKFTKILIGCGVAFLVVVSPFAVIYGLFAYRRTLIDQDFTLDIRKAISANNNQSVFAKDIIKGDWDAVCTFPTGEVNVSEEINQEFNLPYGKSFDVTGTDGVTDDESAVVFINTQTLTADIKLLSYGELPPYKNKIIYKACFHEKEKIKFLVEKESYGSTYTYGLYITDK